MAYTTINKHTDYFNTATWTGTSDSTTSVTGVGFQPDWVWVKNRDVADDHMLFDAIRGVTKRLFSNSSGTEGTDAQTLTSFDSDGFTTGNSRATGGDAGNDMISWNWKAGTTGSGNTTGSGTYKTYSYSVNTTAGFSIIKYTGNGTAGHTIPHHLGATADYVIVKQLADTESWQVISKGMDADKFIQLNSGDAQIAQSSYNMFNSTRPSSTVVTLGNQNHTNRDGYEYIMYAFAEKKGYSNFGSYVSNNNADGTFVYTGFKPTFLLIKNITTGNTGWELYDNKRTPNNVANLYLRANTSDADVSSDRLDILSNGFKLRQVGDTNYNSDVMIYMAFGQSLVGSNNVPCTAR